MIFFDMSERHMKGEHVAKRAKQRERQLFLGRKVIIVSGHQGAVPLSCRAQAVKSSKAQAQFLRPIRGKCSPARPRGQTAAKFLVTGIRRFMKAHAILWQKLCARFSKHTFDQGNRVPVSRVATYLNIRDRVSTKIGRLSQV